MKNVSVYYPYHLPIASIQYMYQTEHWPVSRTTQFLDKFDLPEICSLFKKWNSQRN